MRNLTILKASAAPVALGLALASAPAFAQTVESDTTATSDAAPPTIVVTGSRIRQPNLESASPVTVVGSEEITQTGTTRVEDLVNSLPQVFASQGSTVANGATGTATLNLRGLGSERTLVLVNGRRVVPGDPTSSAADINVIPAVLIERIDVLTGGASSVYGADAVAGVVNFVMDTDFEGFKLDAQYSIYNHDNGIGGDVQNALDNAGYGYPRGMSTNGGTFDATLAFGTSFDDGRGRATAYVGYRKTNPVLQSSRDYSACALDALSSDNVAEAGGLFGCGGSGTSHTGKVDYLGHFVNDDGDPDFGTITNGFGPNRTLRDEADLYNFGPVNYFQRPDERYTAGVFADYEISEAVHPYMEFMFMDDRTVAQIAPSGNFGNTLSINCDNPLLSPSQFAAICHPDNLLVSPDPERAFDVVGNTGEPAFEFANPAGGGTYHRAMAQISRRNVEGGGRQDDLQHTSYRAVIGTRGDLSPAWSYDVYYQYGRTNFAETYLRDFSVTRLGRALDVVDDPNTPEIDAVCRSVLDGSDPSCVPWDIFSPGTVTPSQASIDYLQTPGLARGTVSQQVISGYFAGSLGEYGIQSPWASEGVSIVLGGEYRKDKLEFTPDLSFQTGDLAGQGGATLPVSGSFNVKEFFSEIRLPIVQDSWLHEFTVTGGYRYSDYSTGASTDTYKIEAELAPTRDIRLRGGYNRAVRAPTIQDLFASQRVVLDGSTDPCAGTVQDPHGPITADDVGCLAQGLEVGDTVTPNPAGQYNGLIGGNPDLVPEVADTYTVGAVFTPTFVPGLNLSVDYFNIKVEGAIQGIGADTILDQCGVETVNQFFCDLVVRDGSGSIWRTSSGYVRDLSENIGKLETSGIDIQAGYSHQIGDAGRLTLSFVGTWLDKLDTYSGAEGVPPDECVGRYGNICGVPTPEWRHQARVGFDWANGMGASVRWRHYGSVNVSNIDEDTPPGIARGFDPVNYFDLALTWEVGDHYDFRFGANNIFDKTPPLTGQAACPAGTCNGNTYSQVYDALGRYLYAGVTLEF